MVDKRQNISCISHLYANVNVIFVHLYLVFIISKPIHVYISVIMWLELTNCGLVTPFGNICLSQH